MELELRLGQEKMRMVQSYERAEQGPERGVGQLESDEREAVEGTEVQVELEALLQSASTTLSA